LLFTISTVVGHLHVKGEITCTSQSTPGEEARVAIALCSVGLASTALFAADGAIEEVTVTGSFMNDPRPAQPVTVISNEDCAWNSAADR